MPFITNYNFSRIIDKAKPEVDINAPLYKREIKFFNKTEKERLLRVKAVLEDSKSDLTKIFAKIERDTDTKSMVFEGGLPAYHNTPSCLTLNSEYINFQIPEKVREDYRVDEFRKWFKENMSLILSGNEQTFRSRLAVKFGVDLQGKIQVPNSGRTIFEDLKLDDLEKSIDKILDYAQFLFDRGSVQQKSAITNFASRAFLYSEKYDITKNETGLSEEDLRKVLYIYDTKIKSPVKDLLKTYYMVKYNPKLEFKGSLLEQIGFRKCKSCYGEFN